MEKVESEQKRVSFGYRRGSNGTIGIHDWQAHTVKLIYYCYTEEKMSLAKIKTEIESHKIKTPRGGAVWSRQTVLNILTNHHYVGDETYPQIVTEEQFNAAQERIRLFSERNKAAD